MPGRFLTAAERERLSQFRHRFILKGNSALQFAPAGQRSGGFQNASGRWTVVQREQKCKAIWLRAETMPQFPIEIALDDVINCFTLSPADMAVVRARRGGHNQLGFALQLGALRYLGFCPDDLTTTPTAVVDYLARQLDLAPDALATYGTRAQTRTDHLREIRTHLHFRTAASDDLDALQAWLVGRALEHDRPTNLLQLAAEKLLVDKIVRPGVMSLERLVVAARGQAQIVLDPKVSNGRLRAAIYRQISKDKLQTAVEECEQLVRQTSVRSLCPPSGRPMSPPTRDRSIVGTTNCVCSRNYATRCVPGTSGWRTVAATLREWQPGPLAVAGGGIAAKQLGFAAAGHRTITPPRAGRVAGRGGPLDRLYQPLRTCPGQ